MASNISEYPEIPDTPLILFSGNQRLLEELGPNRYFVFAQYFTGVSMINYLKEIIVLIQRQRETLGIRDCNHDVNQLRVLGTTLYAFNHITANSKNADMAKTVMEGVLYMLNRSYWALLKKYINIEDRDDSQRYFSMLLARSKIEFNSDRAYDKFRGGSIGKTNRKRNCTYKRRGRKGFKTRRH
jgi:hypothetical protein